MSVEPQWVRSEFATKLTETALPTMDIAGRLWQMHGDCAANHIEFNRNVVVNCFVMNTILQNNERWKGSDKINYFVNVSY